MSTFTIKTIGCKVNTYESNKIKDELIKKGLSFIDVDEKENYRDIDYYIINTCSVTSIADKKSRQMIHQALKLNPDIKVIATGCSVENAKKDKCLKELIESKNVSLVDNKDKLDIPKLVTNVDVAPQNTTNVGVAPRSPLKVRSFIKIQDGCNQYCTYCIIPFLRGNIKSRDDDEILAEIKEKINVGVKEIVLTGIHLGSFGLDRVGKSYESEGAIDIARSSLLTLMIKIAGLIEDQPLQASAQSTLRLRLGSLEPRIINEEFLKALTTKPLSDIFCANFCLSLQSGCDKTLRAMNRHYTTKDFSAACELIRKYMPNSTITTDVIVGFPGETEDDFNESLDFVKSRRFYNPNIFPYSRRKGTKADSFANQLTSKVKHDRAIRMISECDKITKEIESEYNKLEHEILIEEVIEENGVRYGIGYTKEYIRRKVVLP